GIRQPGTMAGNLHGEPRCGARGFVSLPRNARRLRRRPESRGRHRGRAPAGSGETGTGQFCQIGDVRHPVSRLTLLQTRGESGQGAPEVWSAIGFSPGRHTARGSLARGVRELALTVAWVRSTRSTFSLEGKMTPTNRG